MKRLVMCLGILVVLLWSCGQVWAGAVWTSVDLDKATVPAGFIGTDPAEGPVNGKVTLANNGNDLWDADNDARFCYVPITGDFEMVCRITAMIDTANVWSKAGILVRNQATTTHCRQVYMARTPGNGHSFQYNADDLPAGYGHSSSGGTGLMPCWLRLTRVGNVFHGYYAVDDSGLPGTWQDYNGTQTVTITMDPTVYLGLFLTSHTNYATGPYCTVSFDNVSIPSIRNFSASPSQFVLARDDTSQKTTTSVTLGPQAVPTQAVKADVTVDDPQGILNTVSPQGVEVMTFAIGSSTPVPAAVTFALKGGVPGTATITISESLLSGTYTPIAPPVASVTLTVTSAWPPKIWPNCFTMGLNAGPSASIPGATGNFRLVAEAPVPLLMKIRMTYDDPSGILEPLASGYSDKSIVAGSSSSIKLSVKAKAGVALGSTATVLFAFAPGGDPTGEAIIVRDRFTVVITDRTQNFSQETAAGWTFYSPLTGVPPVPDPSFSLQEEASKLIIHIPGVEPFPHSATQDKAAQFRRGDLGDTDWYAETLATLTRQGGPDAAHAGMEVYFSQYDLITWGFYHATGNLRVVGGGLDSGDLSFSGDTAYLKVQKGGIRYWFYARASESDPWELKYVGDHAGVPANIGAICKSDQATAYTMTYDWFHIKASSVAVLRDLPDLIRTGSVGKAAITVQKSATITPPGQVVVVENYPAGIIASSPNNGGVLDTGARTISWTVTGAQLANPVSLEYGVVAEANAGTVTFQGTYQADGGEIWAIAGDQIGKTSSSYPLPFTKTEDLCISKANGGGLDDSIQYRFFKVRGSTATLLDTDSAAMTNDAKVATDAVPPVPPPAGMSYLPQGFTAEAARAWDTRDTNTPSGTDGVGVCFSGLVDMSALCLNHGKNAIDGGQWSNTEGVSVWVKMDPGGDALDPNQGRWMPVGNLEGVYFAAPGYPEGLDALTYYTNPNGSVHGYNYAPFAFGQNGNSTVYKAWLSFRFADITGYGIKIEGKGHVPSGLPVSGNTATAFWYHWTGGAPPALSIFNQTPVTITQVAMVNYNLVAASPIPGTINVDQFAARFVGQIYCPTSGTYALRTTSDDGVRLTVDGALLSTDSTDWAEHGGYVVNRTPYLSQGVHDVVLEWYENGGSATMIFEWQRPGDTGFSPVSFYAALDPDGFIYVNELAVFPPTTTAPPDTDPPTFGDIVALPINPSTVRITWETDEFATSEVLYGLTDAYGSTSGFDDTLVMTHEVILINLTRDATYHFMIKSQDRWNNMGTTADGTFTVSDIMPPTILSLTATKIDEVTFKITWKTTSEPSTTQVFYGLSSTYTDSSPLDSTLVNNHEVILSNLQEARTYHYAAESADGWGNTKRSPDKTFTTGVIVRLPDLTVYGVTAPFEAEQNSTMRIGWTVQNIGQGPATVAWQDGVYLSQDAVFGNFDDIYLTSRSSASNIPLAPQDSFTVVDFPVSVPGVDPGSYYVFVHTDYLGEVTEESEANNVDRIDITIIPQTVQNPDLGPPSSITLVPPSPVDKGASVQIGWTVTNIGQGAASVDWHDAVYLSLDMTPDPGELVGTWATLGNLTLPLAASGQYTGSVSVDTTSIAAGTYNVIIQANYLGELTESNTGNNIGSATLEVKEPVRLPDFLPPTNVTVVPSQASQQTVIQISWRGTNSGPGAVAGDWHDAVYLSLTGNLADGVRVAEWSSAGHVTLPLAAVGNYDASVSYTLAAQFTMAIYTVFVVADDLNEVAEVDEGNNTGSGTFEVLRPGDINGDGCVNVSDLLMVRNTMGKTGSGLKTDVAPPGGDGIVNVTDLLYVRNNLGKGVCH